MNASGPATASRPGRWPVILLSGGALLALAVVLRLPVLADSSFARAVVLLVSALISEDLTCVAAGQLVRRGELALPVAIIGCTLGIFVGDVALWVAGRFVARRRPQMLDRLIPSTRLTCSGRSVAATILAARFIPGLRLPVYLAMGAVAVDPVRFSVLALVGAVIWTPLLVLLVSFAGDAVVRPFELYLKSGILSIVAAIVVGLGALQLILKLFTRIGRAQLAAGVSRLWRWEFWPSWLFYLPLIPYVAWLSVRHRGFTTITAANPAIPDGGFVGESKSAILSALSPQFTVPTLLIRSMDLEHRVLRLTSALASRGWSLPIVLKPDVGQRGAGVRVVANIEQATDYLKRNVEPVIAQPFHPGPYEAGIFYFRIPTEPSGRILAITDKHFSTVVGDGRATLEQLIYRHPRYRMQSRVFLARHASQANRILRRGEELALALAGNHCQGTMFRDGSHLITPELERRIDQIARSYDGFYFGRFDVRYSDVRRFMAGEDIAIIELNGITSEATSLYDPSWSLLRAYRLLFKQWSILFRIGAINRDRGVACSSLLGLAANVLGFYRTRGAAALAD